ncbi:hypothetical protein [Streptomyces roseolus]
MDERGPARPYRLPPAYRRHREDRPIIISVFLQPGEDPKDMVASASYDPLVAVLNGLRSHSEHLVSDIASRALTRGEEHREVHVQRDEDGRIIPTAPGAGVEDDEDQADDAGDVDEAGKAARAAVESALLRFATPRDPATIAAFLRTRVYRPEPLVWLEGYQALRRWRAENGITGCTPSFTAPRPPRRR